MTAFAFTAAVFLTAAGALVLEIVAARLIAPYVGMSLYTWTAIIAVVLAGLSLGHWLGGRFAGRDVSHREGIRRTASALVAAAVSTLMSLPLLRVVSGPLLAAGMGAVSGVVLLTGLLFFLPSLFVGIVSPLVTKLAIDAEPEDAGRVLGRMFAAGAAGSILGTLAAGYLFISWVGATGTVLAVAGLYAGLAGLFGFWAKRGIVAMALLIAPAAVLAAWGTSVQAFRSPCQIESDYFCIRFDDFSAMTGRPSRLMVLDHLVHSINDRDDPALLYSPYVHFVDEVTDLRLPGHNEPTAFFIGGGGYTLPRAWARVHPEMKMTVAELDPAVTRAAADKMWLDADDPDLRVLHQDARRALKELPFQERFDVVFGDAFHDIAVPAHLVTREFHQELAARMTKGGFYAVNVVDLGSDPRFLFALVKTLRLDFPTVEVWKTVGEMDEGGRVTFIIIAGAAPTSVDRLSSLRGLARTWARWPGDDLERRIAAANPPALTDDFAPVERLLSRLLQAPDV
jgi:predicted membrane-bound spermidine synthase